MVECRLVVDPSGGSGTTGIAALALSRRCLLIDNNPAYCEVAAERLKQEAAALPEEISIETNGKKITSIFRPIGATASTFRAGIQIPRAEAKEKLTALPPKRNLARPYLSKG
jgi:hypothetical protein